MYSLIREPAAAALGAPSAAGQPENAEYAREFFDAFETSGDGSLDIDECAPGALGSAARADVCSFWGSSCHTLYVYIHIKTFDTVNIAI